MHCLHCATSWQCHRVIRLLHALCSCECNFWTVRVASRQSQRWFAHDFMHTIRAQRHTLDTQGAWYLTVGSMSNSISLPVNVLTLICIPPLSRSTCCGVEKKTFRARFGIVRDRKSPRLGAHCATPGQKNKARYRVCCCTHSQAFSQRSKYTAPWTKGKVRMFWLMYQVQCGFLLNVVVRQGSSIFKLLASEDQTLLVRRDPFLVLDFALDHVYCVWGFNLAWERVSEITLESMLNASPSLLSNKATSLTGHVCRLLLSRKQSKFWVQNMKYTLIEQKCLFCTHLSGKFLRTDVVKEWD